MEEWFCRSSMIFKFRKVLPDGTERMTFMAENTVEKLESLLRPTVESCGVSLWDVEFVREGPSFVLRITIDKENGVDLEDCEKVHHAVDPVLDTADPIESAYNLEVTSPGLERTLRKPAHALPCGGEKVEVSLFAKVGDKKKYAGRLAAYVPGEALTLETDSGAVVLPLDKVAKAKTVFDW